MEESIDMEIQHKGTGKRMFLAVLAFALSMYLVGLGARHLWNADEPRVAGVAAHMSNTGEFAVPRLNGLEFLEKPPLYFWTTAVTFNIIGQNNFAARFPSALSAVGGLLVIYLLARRMRFSIVAACLSVLICATSIEYWSIGRRCIIDMMLAFFITATMACFYLSVTTQKRRFLWSITFVIMLGLSVLTKGLVGLAIPASAIFFWLILKKDFSLRSWGVFIGGSILCFIPTAMWAMALCDVLGKEKVYEVMIANNIGRFTGGHAEHVEPFYYYLLRFPGQFMPWALFLPLVFMHCRKTVRFSKKEDPTLFLLCWLIVPFALLSVASGKRGLYLLPLYPAAAMLVAQAIGWAIENRPPTKWFTSPAFIVAVVVVLTPIAFIVLSIRHNQPVAMWPLVLIPGLALGVWGLRTYMKENFVRFLAISGVAMAILFATHDAVIEPVKNDTMSSEPLMNYCSELQTDGKEIALFCAKERLSGAAVFYLKDTVPIYRNAKALLAILRDNENAVAITYIENLKGSDKIEMPEGSVMSDRDVEILKQFKIASDTVVVIKHKTPDGVAGDEDRS